MEGDVRVMEGISRFPFGLPKRIEQIWKGLNPSNWIFMIICLAFFWGFRLTLSGSVPWVVSAQWSPSRIESCVPIRWGSGIPLVDYLPRFLLGGLLMQTLDMQRSKGWEIWRDPATWWLIPLTKWDEPPSSKLVLAGLWWYSMIFYPNPFVHSQDCMISMVLACKMAVIILFPGLGSGYDVSLGLSPMTSISYLSYSFRKTLHWLFFPLASTMNWIMFMATIPISWLTSTTFPLSEVLEGSMCSNISYLADKSRGFQHIYII